VFIKKIISKNIYLFIILFYRGYPNKYPFSIKSDFSTSMVKGIIPDKYTMDYTKQQTEISEELKNRVRNMLNK